MATNRAPKIAILASGSGTTTEAFVLAGVTGKIDAGVGLVICNNSDAGVFDKIDNLNKQHGLDIQTLHINGKTHPAKADEHIEPGCQTTAEENEILRLLEAGNFDLIVLMGYMKKVGPKLVHAFGWQSEYTTPLQAKMLNTHPGLLPQTKGLTGKNAQIFTLENNMENGGQTLHVVSEDYDDGPIIAEHKVPVETGDTPETLFVRVQKVEKLNLPTDVDAFIINRQNYLIEMEGAK